MIRPLGNRIFLKRIKIEEKTYNGLIIPDTAQDKPMEAIVAFVGPGSYDKNGDRKRIAVSVGDRVIIGKWSGDDVTVQGEEYVIVTENDIVGVLKERINENG